MSILFSIRCPQSVLSIVSLLLSISFSFSASSQNAEKKICQTKECLASVKNFKESMDFNVNPCDDFYTYACGNWSRNSDESSTMIASSVMENYVDIIDFLTQNNSEDEPEAVHKARKFYSLCRKRAAYKNDLQQIETMLEKIGIPVDSLNSSKFAIFDYTAALARAARLTGAKLYFDLEIFPNPYNKTADKIGLMVHSNQNKYEAVKRMCGRSKSTSCTRLLLLLNFAKNLTTEENSKRRSKILKIQNFALTSNDYQIVDTEIKSALNSNRPVRYSLKQLQTLTDNIAVEVNSKISTLNWTRYIEELIIDRHNTFDLSDPSKLQISITELDSIKEMLKYIHNRQNIKIIAYEILQEVVYTLQPYVDSTTSRKIMVCTKKTEKLFRWVISHMFAKKEKYIKAKTEVRTIFEHVREAFQQLLEQSSWMDEITRQRALKKLRWMRSYIAYPSTITNSSILDNFYKNVQITDNFYDTVISLNRLKNTELMKDPPDDDWHQLFLPAIAQYATETNSVYIPAGILGFPLYDDGLDALHFGAIGSTVGHEIGHAFDNNGRRYNEVGDIEDWWEPETAKLFEEKAICFAQANRNYSATSNDSRFRRTHFNKYNLGEDLSDNLGFKQSLLAYKNYISACEKEPSLPQFEHFTQEQLLTLAFANKDCETPPRSKDTLFDGSSMNQHSPAEYRVNGVFQNSEEFSKIWKCPEGSRMNPVKKCTLW